MIYDDTCIHIDINIHHIMNFGHTSMVLLVTSPTEFIL